MINSYAVNSIPINGTGGISGKLNLTLQVNIIEKQQTGSAGLNLRIITKAKSSISFTLSISVQDPQNVLILPLSIVTSAVGSAVLPLSIHTYDKSAFTQTSSQWKIKLLLDSIDVSENLVNQCRVEAEESTAKIAEFTLVPFAGAISLTKWVGKPVAIYYQTFNTTGALLSDNLLFQGVVDEPIYDPTSRLTTFVCSDQLQEKVNQFPQNEISSLLNSSHSEIVFGTTEDNWQYAQNLLSTTPQSLDLNRFNQLQASQWAAKSNPDFIFSEDNILYQSINVQLANRREIHNAANIKVQYRFTRLKQREIIYDYRYPLSFCEQNNRRATLPNTNMIQQAVESTGWILKDKISYVNQIGSGWVTCGGVTFGYLISEELQKSLVREARFVLSKRYTQPITETYNITLKAPQSAKQFGDVSQTESFTHERQLPENTFVEKEYYQAPIQGSVLDINQDYVFDYDDRSILNQAIVTKLQKARTAILKAHRNNTVSFNTVIQPLIECRHTAKIDTQYVKATGKVKHIVHTCDFNQGGCTTSITLAVSRTDNDSIVSELPLGGFSKLATIEAGSQLARISLPTYLGGRLNALPYDESWDGYTGNELLEPGAIKYPERFAISTPAIEQQPLNVSANFYFEMNIPNEELILS